MLPASIRADILIHKLNVLHHFSFAKYFNNRLIINSAYILTILT